MELVPGDAAATAEFELNGGIRYVYTGSWCSPGFETSWVGSWRVSASGGTATWNGVDLPMTEDGPVPRPTQGAGEDIAGSLAAFVHALRTGEAPSGEIHANLPSLAMVEAAVRSAATGSRVLIADLMEEARNDAIANEPAPDVRHQLTAGEAARFTPERTHDSGY